MESHKRLEQVFGIWASVNNCVACSSGTAALHLALETLALPQGGEVIVPDFTMVACPRAVKMAGLEPVFVDCRHDLNMNPDLIEEAITDKTVAIMVVHIYGRTCDMGSIMEIAAKYNLPVIEDLAECHGLIPDALTAVACWSFYKNKIIAGEEGGMCAFKDEIHAERAQSLRSLGFTPDHNYSHIARGCNYRLANCLAELIFQSIEDYSVNAAARSEIVEWYDSCCPSIWRMPARFAHWVYDLRIQGLTEEQQDKVVRVLQGANIRARHGFKPMHKQPEFFGAKWVTNGRECEAEVMSREVIYLPCDPAVVTLPSVKEAMAIICLNI